jgi:hypothetical protein
MYWSDSVNKERNICDARIYIYYTSFSTGEKAGVLQYNPVTYQSGLLLKK